MAMLLDKQGVPRLVQSLRVGSGRMIEAMLFDGLWARFTVEDVEDTLRVPASTLQKILYSDDPSTLYDDMDRMVLSRVWPLTPSRKYLQEAKTKDLRWPAY